MRFAIQDGAPYLISGGRAFPVEITEKKEVIIDNDNASMTDETGYLTLDEVIAKIGYTKKDESQGETGEQPEEAEDSETASLLGDGQEDNPQGEKKGRKKSNLS